MTATANTKRYKPVVKIVLALAAVLLIFFVAMKLLLREHEQTPTQGGLAKLATELNKHAPRALDSSIRLDYVHVLDDRVIQYYHTCRTLDRKQVDTDSFAKSIRSLILQAETPDIRYCKKYGVKIEWWYVDRNKDQICVVKVEPGDFPAMGK